MSGADCRSSRANPRIRPLKTVAKGDEGALYHVIVRGNHRRDIFRDESDRVTYLQRVEHYRVRYRCMVFAYVLMSNHVHLLIETGAVGLSKIMQGIQFSYTQR